MGQDTPQTHYVSFSSDISPQAGEALLAVMAQLAGKQVQEVYLMISTVGGSVITGMNLYNVLRGMPFKLITHNAGSVNSIGNVVFLAGEERYAGAHTTFMFHGVGFDVTGQMRFEEKTLRERLDAINSDQRRMGDIITERTTLDRNAVDELFLEAKTQDATYARTNGIIHEIREISIPPGAPITQLVFKR